MQTSFRFQRSHEAFRQSAFTLVELLVVITVIAVLISMLLPAMAQARLAARDVSCKSNLRQIAIGTNNYAVDYKDLTPAAQMWNPFSIFYKQPGLTAAELAGVDARPLALIISSGSSKVYFCPRGTYSPSSWYASTAASATTIGIGYGLLALREPTPFLVNYSIANPQRFADLPAPTPGSTGNRPRKASAIRNPDIAAVATDAQNSYNWSYHFSYPGYRPNPWDETSNYIFAHRRANNTWDGTATSFFDGHVAFSKREVMGLPTALVADSDFTNYKYVLYSGSTPPPGSVNNLRGVWWW